MTIEQQLERIERLADAVLKAHEWDFSFDDINVHNALGIDIPRLVKALRHAVAMCDDLAKMHLAKSFNPLAYLADRNCEIAKILEGEQ